MIGARMLTKHPTGTCAWTILVCLMFGAAAAFGQDDPGKAAYTRACETCHGPNGNGDAQGPPLVPLAHGRAELTAIVRQGVGLMPAMPRSEVSDADIEQLYAYLKRLSGGSMATRPQSSFITKARRPRRSRLYGCEVSADAGFGRVAALASPQLA